ncbi:Autophagy-related protein 17 [Penicillium argentinense]|uniref:Autophagy-related protein 17 n=1 Tax=Penicillium argentinense TaxID=1131581 RepID=A0A9W9FLT2_9EURO|nr:Autophagy-related protein 17 [Penicillium argentinense]KAJ5102546.1 Autophagy-related protein 17 [Penicillium argentinense]
MYSQSSSASIPRGDNEYSKQDASPTLDTLVSYLIVAKRGLSSYHYVWRANEIVTDARTALEDSVVASSRTTFLRRGLNSQLRMLYKVRSEVAEISRRGRSEFTDAIHSLDTADARLRSTINLLKETFVHASFRPKDEEPKSLYGFLDERGVEELNTAMKDSIDRTNTARRDLDTSNQEFDDELDSTRQALHQYRSATKLASSRASASSSSSSASESDLQAVSLMPGMLQSLEEHARKMARNLESLVNHFDLCVKVLKHTEGGGAAARSITGDITEDVNAGNVLNIEETLDAPQAPISAKEYRDMLEVIVNDTPVAEDVVVELQDRINDMESIFEQVIVQRDSIFAISDATVVIHRHLSKLASTRLPRFIAQAHNFTRVWNEEHERINSGLTELSDLHALYEGFLNAYDSLILEVTRRAHVRKRVDKILHDTQHKLTQLYEHDVASREAFRVEQGDFLPSDIWPGIGRAPMQVKFLRLSGGQLEGALTAEENTKDRGVDTSADAQITTPEDLAEGEVIPSLPKDIIERAYARVKARTRDLVKE